MGATAIEWTDFSTNPIRARLKATGAVGHYCEKVSAGCANCYSSTFQKRFQMPAFGSGQHRAEVEIFLDESKLREVLRRKKPTKYFWCDMTDLFGDWVPDEMIDKCFAAMTVTPWHTHQILTKRPERMKRYITSRADSDTISDVLYDWMNDDTLAATRIEVDSVRQVRWGRGGLHSDWPLPNVWLGVSVEDQQRADERVPLLCKTPAAVRFLSCEPLLGAVDLNGWGEAASDETLLHGVPECWTEYKWPDWVPEEQRKHIESFWGVGHGRSPVEWLRDHIQQSAPRTGAMVGVRKREGFGVVINARNPMADAVGRYLHCWNNIGRVIVDGGEVLYVSFLKCGEGWLSRWLQRDGEYRHNLHWVIVGGESGQHARPMHSDWARSIRDQCQAAGVPFFFKQWGEWLPYEQAAQPPFWIGQNGDEVDGHCFPEEITEHEPVAGWYAPQLDGVVYRRVGKQVAGRLLDGSEWNEFPQRHGAPA